MGEWEDSNSSIDIDDDGVIELLQIRFGGIDLIEFSFDNDNDGVINQNDANPNDPYSKSNDVNGNRNSLFQAIIFLYQLKNLSCPSDGSIAVSAKDENLNYTLTINGKRLIDNQGDILNLSLI